MNDTTTANVRTAQKSARLMATTPEGWITSWNALTVETQTALMTAVRAATAGEHSDVTEHAALIVADVYKGIEGLSGAARTLKAARRARAIARRVVAMAGARRNELAAGVTAGDIEESTETEGHALPLSTAPRPDGIATVTWADLTTTALVMANNPALMVLASQYRGHLHAGGCDNCSETGARPTMAGMLAHAAGATRGTAEYKRLMRDAHRALETVPGRGVNVRDEADKGEAPARAAWDALAHRVGDPAPMAGRPTHTSASHMTAPATTAHPEGHIGFTRTRTLPAASRTVAASRAQVVSPEGTVMAWEGAPEGPSDAWRASYGRDGWRYVPARTAGERTLPAVTVTRRSLAPVAQVRAGATVRAMTEAEREQIRAPRTGPGAVESIALPEGETAGEGHAPHRADNAAGTAPRSHKPVVSPRKRPGGQTGPTVTGSPARLGMTR